MPDKKPPRSVIVTGATRGVGLGVSVRLAAAGYRVVGVGRKQNATLAKAIETAAKEGKGEIIFRPFDLSDIEAISDFAYALKRDHGPIWGLVNNAGLGTEGVLANMHNSQIEQLIRLNTVSPIVLTKYIVRSMLTERCGRIVNMSSIIASTGYSGLSVYAATKASLVGFTKSLAREVGRVGVTVNAVAPGFMDTEMTTGLDDADRSKIAKRSALRRLAEVEDVAVMVEYLLSDAAKNITGTVMTVDAGNTA
ncbi:MAG TPA: SDR family oxidoreductase [Caulobacteraceae bacterium]|jgi:3-oxoacyl-[acyl-carrier protein] reductase|nr:SDR family oxidoreductase [Caulobacteraceae bacterium]